MFRLMVLETREILKGEELDSFVVTHDYRVLEKVENGDGCFTLQDRSDQLGILRVVPNG